MNNANIVMILHCILLWYYTVLHIKQKVKDSLSYKNYLILEETCRGIINISSIVEEIPLPNLDEVCLNF